MNTSESVPLAKSLVRVALATIALLMVPMLVMQLTDEVAWGPGDFVVAGALLFAAGVIYVLGARAVHTATRRVAVGAAVAAVLALVWAELAVGLFT